MHTSSRRRLQDMVAYVWFTITTFCFGAAHVASPELTYAHQSTCLMSTLCGAVMPFRRKRCAFIMHSDPCSCSPFPVRRSPLFSSSTTPHAWTGCSCGHSLAAPGPSHARRSSSSQSKLTSRSTTAQVQRNAPLRCDEGVRHSRPGQRGETAEAAGGGRRAPHRRQGRRRSARHAAPGALPPPQRRREGRTLVPLARAAP